MSDSGSKDQIFRMDGSYDDAPRDYGLGDYNDFPDFAYGGTNCSGHSKFLDELKSFYAPSMIVVPSIYCIICLVGLIGNGLVIFVIVGSREMTKSVANIYILNLAIADTLLLLALPFSSTQRVLLAWPFGIGMCKIVEAVKYLSYFASIFFLTAMSVDRYFAVVHVVKASRYRTNKNTYSVCLLVWLASFVMIIPLLIYTKIQGEICVLVFVNSEVLDGYNGDFQRYDDDAYYSDYQLCDNVYMPDYMSVYPTGPINESVYEIVGESNNTMNENLVLQCRHPESRQFHVFIIVTFVLGFILPFNIITVSYAMIVAKLLQPSESRSRSRQADRTRRKVTRMVVALVVTYFVCWSPFYIWHIVMIKGLHLKLGTCHNVRDFTFCLGFANSCLNPLLYTFLGHNFQERLRRSIALSLRPFTLSTFPRYTTNTFSRADTAMQTKKMDATNTEAAGEVAPKVTRTPSQIPEEEQPCITSDANANHEIAK